MELVKIGKRIEKLRKDSNLSRKVLAEFLGINEKELEKIEKGNNAHIEMETIRKIADLYFCSEDYIIKGTDEIDGRVPFDYTGYSKYRLEGIAKVFGAVRDKRKDKDIQLKTGTYKDLTAKEIYKQRWTGISIDSPKISKQIHKEEVEEEIETKEEREQREFEEVQWDEYFFNDFNPYGL